MGVEIILFLLLTRVQCIMRLNKGKSLRLLTKILCQTEERFSSRSHSDESENFASGGLDDVDVVRRFHYRASKHMSEALDCSFVRHSDDDVVSHSTRSVELNAAFRVSFLQASLRLIWM